MTLRVLPKPPERRNDKTIATREHYREGKGKLDPHTGLYIVKIFSGDWYVSTEAGEMLVTILGSCISACIRDPQIGVGGMNHFLLPGNDSILIDNDAASRYGVFAMESLINAILKEGGRKDRLEVKVFGGGNVLNTTAKIGSKNAAFIRGFLKNEGIKIASEDLEGELPRRIHYYPDTGKVLMRKLNRKEDLIVVQEEEKYTKNLTAQPVEGEIDLF